MKKLTKKYHFTSIGKRAYFLLDANSFRRRIESYSFYIEDPFDTYTHFLIMTQTIDVQFSNMRINIYDQIIRNIT